MTRDCFSDVANHVRLAPLTSRRSRRAASVNSQYWLGIAPQGAPAIDTGVIGRTISISTRVESFLYGSIRPVWTNPKRS